MFQRDMEKYGGWTLFYINKNIPFKVLELNSTTDDNEVLLVEFF